MISIRKLLLEDKGKHTYGCVMLYFKFPQLKKIQSEIDEEDIYKGEDGSERTFGLETDPHITLLYGLHEGVSILEVKSVLNQLTFSTCTVHNASLFTDPEYDVLKFDVSGQNLKEANKALKEFPFTSDFDVYHPHLTIGYLKPGTGKKYTKMLSGFKFNLTPVYAVYSMTDGTKNKIKIKVNE